MVRATSKTQLGFQLWRPELERCRTQLGFQPKWRAASKVAGRKQNPMWVPALATQSSWKSCGTQLGFQPKGRATRRTQCGFQLWQPGQAGKLWNPARVPATGVGHKQNPAWVPPKMAGRRKQKNSFSSSSGMPSGCTRNQPACFLECPARNPQSGQPPKPTLADRPQAQNRALILHRNTFPFGV